MSALVEFFFRPARGPAGILLIRLAVGLIFLTQGILKYTKIPELFQTNQGFWYMVSDARTDFAMLCSLLFLIWMGGGAWSVDVGHVDDSRR